MRMLAALALASLFLPAQAGAGPLTGAWSGSYSCGNLSGASFTLTTEQAANGIISGTFAFEIGDGAGAIKGAYKLLGREDAGQIRLQPRDWIERPPGIEAKALELATRDDGAVIDGKVLACGLNDRLIGASAERMAARQEQMNAEPVPPTMDGPAGLWQGEISCQGPRKTQLSHPVTALLLSDQGRIVADVLIAQPQGQQRTILGGAAGNGGLALEAKGVLTKDVRPMLQGLTLTGNGDRLGGRLKMNRCDAVSLTRSGKAAIPPLPDSLAGSWIGSTGQQYVAAARLELRNGAAGGFAELHLSQPANLPLEQRSKGRLVMLPVGASNGWTLLLPIGQRAHDPATGDQRPIGWLTFAWAYLMAPDDRNGLVLVALNRREDYLRTATLAPGQVSGDGRLVSITLARPDAATADAMQSGQTPPVILPRTLAGTLAAAPSREAQCALLQDWIRPVAEGKDLRGNAADVLERELAEAFTDAHFEPVFGLPLALLAAGERQALARFMREDCGQGQRMKDVAFAGQYVIGHQAGYERMVKRLADVAESSRWSVAALAEAQTLASTPAALARIKALRAEGKRRAAELTAAQTLRLEQGLQLRARQIRTDLLRADLDRDLPGLSAGTVEDGALDRLFRLAARIARDDILPEARAELHARVAAPAIPMAEAAITRLAAEGTALPVTLQGLAGARGVWRRLTPILAGLSMHFGQNATPRIADFERHEEAILADPGVLAAFRHALDQVPVRRPMPATIRNAALLYLDEDTLKTRPEYAAALDDAILAGELRAIDISGDSNSQDPNEPTARDIAEFALDRVREANAVVSQTEDACMRGPEALGNNVVRMIECLAMPALWTGKKGFGVELISVRKISCAAVDRGYSCYFKQDIQPVGPGGIPMSLEDFVGRFGAAAAALDVQEALFIPKGNGWHVLWESPR